MNRYGQNIKWSTVDAPHPFTGDCTSYSARDVLAQQLIDDEKGDRVALALHSRKTEIRFEAIVRDGSTDFLDLSDGARITFTDAPDGLILCTRAVERWALGQPKTAAITAIAYPHMPTNNPDNAAVHTMSAFTPAPDTAFVHPGDTLIYGTKGLEHDTGIVHGLTIEQQLSITEDEPTPDGEIVGAATHGYLRTIQLELLVNGDLPENGTPLGLSSSLDHAKHYLITSVTPRYAMKRARMCSVSAVWIQPFNEIVA